MSIVFVHELAIRLMMVVLFRRSVDEKAVVVHRTSKCERYHHLLHLLQHHLLHLLHVASEPARQHPWWKIHVVSVLG